jgi:hypothetical protein
MRLEPYGLMLLIGLLFILPLLGAQLGIDLNIVCSACERRYHRCNSKLDRQQVVIRQDRVSPAIII